MMQHYKTLHFYKGPLKFSSGHFTIFSATERERLHGHNYALEVSISAAIDQPGITFDYRIFKEKILTLCKHLHRYFLLPGESPYLMITEQDEYYYAEFNHKKIPFLKEDVLILPLTNITLEELSKWFVCQLISDQSFIKAHDIKNIIIKVFNSNEQSAEAVWGKVKSESPVSLAG